MLRFCKGILFAVLCLALCGITEGCSAEKSAEPSKEPAKAEGATKTMGKYDLIVSQDGSGDYKSVQEAIEAAHIQSKQPFVIFIKKGVYKEKVIISKQRSNITLVGEDRDHTVITYDDYSGTERPPGKKLDNQEIPTVYITANDFQAENITFENSAGTIAQALAMYVNGDRAVFRNVRFLGWQDTLRVEGANKRSYFKDCYIEGHVDYIYGSGTAVFENSTIFSKKGGYITASSAPQEAKYGMVFLNSELKGDAEPGTVYLGRPWRDYATVAFINCTMGSIIKPAGWHNWNNPDKEHTARYAEYNSKGPGAAIVGRVAWSKQLSEEETKAYSVKNILAGSDGWNPKASLQ